ncbi:MAG: hypothetical protein Unbinned664contig1000_44 [Prokaryotic dsDNA virus sp.]|nr:MAG: hypothetical protein Unbinned664contig1000_44 [Prokaryotic dsDNA virus sp.]|tara:strand:- start:855 stop:2156 length:1302 start_codon:yes stop_codon:yes gene_type:complete
MAEEDEKYTKPGSLRRSDGSSSALGFYSQGVQPTEISTPTVTAPQDPIASVNDDDRDRDSDGNQRGGFSGEPDQWSDNAQFIDVDPDLQAASRLASLAAPGLSGLAIGAVNAGINLNNLDWANNQRAALGLPDMSGWGALAEAGKAALGFSDYAKGKVGAIDVDGRQYSVTKGGGMVDERTTLTPAEALARQAAAKAYGANPGARVQERQSGGNENRDIDRQFGPGGAFDKALSVTPSQSLGGRTNLGGQPVGSGSGGNSGGGGYNAGPDGNYGMGDSSVGGGRGSNPGRGSSQDKAENNGGEFGGGGNSGGGGSERVICTELYRQGKISRADWLRDLRYTSLALSPRHVRGYHAWAIPTVRLMRRSPIWTAVWRVLGQARANQIAYIMGDRNRPDLFGIGAKIVLEGFCWIVGGFVGTRDVKTKLYDGKEPV